MYIATTAKCIDHLFIIRHDCRNAKLDLRIVESAELESIGSNKCATHRTSELGADGNVLQIRCLRRHASRCCTQLDKCRVEATIFTKHLGESINIG